MKNKISYVKVFGIVGVSCLMFLNTAFADNRHITISFPNWLHQPNQNRNDDRHVDQKDINTNMEVDKNGNVVVRGGTITSISSNQIVVNLVLGQSTLTLVGQLDGSTKFEGKNGKTMNPSNIVVGDKVTLKGVLLSGNSLNIRASLVRDVSRINTSVPVQPGNVGSQIYEGRLVGLSSTNTPTTLVMQVGSQNYTVGLYPYTIVLNSSWANSSLANFLLGDTVRVFGYVPTGTTTITGLVLRNASR